nr:immunoglobulin heavy chain junction region [Macaca mulatta]MOX14746.1 immunoglobulin heavy chain junction region [Macaca mulatta]MOX14930.1 immunoglobulin heavy chain junction region [Macaca mulatta]MOX15376.1 immunoglobulin heavy chain junction region [Macaca mulatta]MOX15496.1 immunoglobulin heavy chain junction region [Macaca mulatta]
CARAGYNKGFYYGLDSW